MELEFRSSEMHEWYKKMVSAWARPDKTRHLKGLILWVDVGAMRSLTYLACDRMRQRATVVKLVSLLVLQLVLRINVDKNRSVGEVF